MAAHIALHLDRFPYHIDVAEEEVRFARDADNIVAAAAAAVVGSWARLAEVEEAVPYAAAAVVVVADLDAVVVVEPSHLAGAYSEATSNRYCPSDYCDIDHAVAVEEAHNSLVEVVASKEKHRLVEGHKQTVERPEVDGAVAVVVAVDATCQAKQAQMCSGGGSGEANSNCCLVVQTFCDDDFTRVSFWVMVGREKGDLVNGPSTFPYPRAPL